MEYVSTKRVEFSRKPRTCHICGETIAKGDPYFCDKLREDREQNSFRGHGNIAYENTCVPCYWIRHDFMSIRNTAKYSRTILEDYIIDHYCGRLCDERGSCTCPLPLSCKKLRGPFGG